jgi:arsenate reductase
MAEALLRWLGGGQFAVFTAETEPTRVNQLAVWAMVKLGLDIADARSKSVSEFIGQSFDYVITVCDDAQEQCPVFPDDTERIHWSYPDPSAATGTETERQHAFDLVAVDLMNRLRLWVEVAKREKAATA